MSIVTIRDYEKEDKGKPIARLERTDNKLFLIEREVIGKKLYEFKEQLVPCGPRKAKYQIDPSNLNWNE